MRTTKFDPRHQHHDLPTHLLTVFIVGVILSLISITGGIILIASSGASLTEFVIFGVKFTTGHLGVALIGIGLIIVSFTARIFLKEST